MATDTKSLVINEVLPSGHDPPVTIARNLGNSVEITRTCTPENESINFNRRADTYKPNRLSSDERNASDLKVVNGYHLDLEAGAKYDKYIIVAFVVTVLCCWPIGLCAIFSAYRARLAARLRDEDETALYISRATTQIIWTVFAGFLVLMIFILFFVVKIQSREL